MIGLLASVLGRLEESARRRLRLCLADERLVGQADPESTQGAYSRAFATAGLGATLAFLPPVDETREPGAE